MFDFMSYERSLPDCVRNGLRCPQGGLVQTKNATTTEEQKAEDARVDDMWNKDPAAEEAAREKKTHEEKIKKAKWGQ
jgi:hypothetical protein